MALIERQVYIAAPIDAVYRASQDYAVRYEWDPFPESIAVVAGEPGGAFVSTQVRVESKPGLSSFHGSRNVLLSCLNKEKTVFFLASSTFT